MIDQQVQAVMQRAKQERASIVMMYSEVVSDLRQTIARQEQVIAAQKDEIERLTAGSKESSLQAAE